MRRLTWIIAFWISAIIVWNLTVSDGIQCSNESRPHVFKWAGMVFEHTYFIGGASLIHPRYAVTAAHIISNKYNPQHYAVYFGVHDKSARSIETRYQFEKIVIHPNFTIHPSGILDNDIAVIRLARSAIFSSTVSSVQLPSRPPGTDPRENCVITGWGYDEIDGEVSSAVLRRGTVPYSPYRICNGTNYFNGTIPNSMFCAGWNGVLNQCTDSCKLDSGGALQCSVDVEKTWVLQGIVSFGPIDPVNRKCGPPKNVGVYTKVHMFLTWIQAVIQKEGD